MLRQTKLSFVTLGTAAVVLAGVVTFNATIDANDLMLDNPFRGDATGKYVAEMRASPEGVRYSSEERRIKAKLAQVANADCYIIGSSQIMIVNRATLPSLAERCRETVNLGVSGSALEDSGMFAGLVGSKDTTHFLLFGIDPWSFKLNQDRRWREVEPSFWQARNAIGLPQRDGLSGNPDTPAIFRLFSYAYLDRNWQFLEKERHRAEAAVEQPDVGNAANDYLRFMPDGTLKYPRSVLDRDPLRPLDDGSYRIEKPFIDPLAVAEWRAIISWLLGRGIKVALIVPPYHPSIWACHNETVCEGLKAAEATARQLAAEMKIEVVGGYDPRPFKLTPYDYIDERHLRPEAIHRLEAAQNE